jgi:hypothetical protein
MDQSFSQRVGCVFHAILDMVGHSDTRDSFVQELSVTSRPQGQDAQVDGDAEMTGGLEQRPCGYLIIYRLGNGILGAGVDLLLEAAHFVMEPI